MRTEVKTHVKNSIGRLVFVGLAFLLQVGWLISLFLWLSDYSTTINLLCTIAALVLVLLIYGKHQLAAFKMPWIIVILTFPILGLCLFALFGHKGTTKKMRIRFEEIDPKLLAEIQQDRAVMDELEKGISQLRTSAGIFMTMLNFRSITIQRLPSMRKLRTVLKHSLRN